MLIREAAMPYFLETVSPYVELFLNIIELFAIIISVTTFFVLMINKYGKALKKILGPCGLTFGPRMRVLFMCRRSQTKKRAFLEYAILETGGSPVLKSEWHIIINSFKSFYVDADQSNLKYSISNCTPLIESDFSSVTERYFRYFSEPKVRKAFGIQDEQLKWVIKIHIEEAYATPTCLLTGLLSQYDENWEEFIKRYVSTAYITENGDAQSKNVLSNELYFTFAWLLWGPSYELEFRRYWAGLCQLSYGDESNSIPAVADTDSGVADRLKNRFLSNEERRYGALISADISIYDKKPFFASLRSVINPNNVYFYDKVERGELSFGVKVDDFVSCVNYKAKKYYSTAYVWILFELEDGEYSFKPEKSVAFFEHANLANKVTYKFLIETLIDKSLKHFESIFSTPETSKRRYRFVCAMNDKIAIECIERYREVMNSGTPFGELLADRIIMEPKHSPADVFSTYDEYFSPTNLVEYVDVSLDSPESISDFGQFYTDIYMEAFPDDNERETFDNFLKYLKRSADATEYKYHVVLAKGETGRIVGGCVFNYYKKSNTGVIEFLAVRSDMQSCGIGSVLYNHVLSMLSEDAYRIVKKPLEYVCCEIDSPEYSKAEIKKYLYFWNKNNFWHLDFDYVQPALSAGQEPVRGLWLIVSPQRSSCTEFSATTLLDVLYDYIKYAMAIDDPEKCPEYIAMKNQLLEKGAVNLSKII